MVSKQNITHLSIIFATVFLYLLGFGVMIPIMPIIGKEYGASPLTIGLLMSIYSLMQFLFSPFWGRLSDQKGRRPILLLCLFGEALSYILFAFSPNLEGLFLSRALAGFFGASISTASASISDVTPSNERTKGMALIGAAFGLGFIIGPAIGGGLSLLGEAWFPQYGPTFGMRFAAGNVSLICFLTWIFAWIYLKETVHLSKKEQSFLPKKNRFQILGRFLKTPLVGPLIGNFFLNSLAMSTMEATLILFAGDRFGWGIREVSFGFAYLGLLSTLNQGFLVRKLLPLLGERVILKSGLIFQCLGYTLIAFSNSIPLLTLAMTILSLGNGFVNPSLMGSISLVSKPTEQGEALGTAQGTASLGRILGPAIGGYLYGNLSLTSPFFLAGGFTLISFFIVYKLGNLLPNQAQKKKKSPFHSLNAFQFNNLVYNRVNFILLHDSIDFNSAFHSHEINHINKIEVSINFSEKPEKWIERIDEKSLNKDWPIVLIKNEGQIESSKIEVLSSLTHNNICPVDKSWIELKNEIKTI